MLKKGLVLFGTLAIVWNMGSICQASIIPAHGPGQIGLSSVVLCESLSLRQDPSADSATVKTMHYGDRIIVMSQKDGWAEICLSDAVDASPGGWANADFIAIDPAWYKTDEVTPVYAWNDTGALKVAELDKDTILPILKDNGEWLVVSLRGASGWIYKTDADYAANGQSSNTAAEQSGNTAAGQSSNTTAGQSSNTTAGQSSDASASQGNATAGQDGWTGADFGEGAGLEDNWADYYAGKFDQSEVTNSGYGEGAGLEDNWADYYAGKFDQSEVTNSGYGEGAGLEDNWADYYAGKFD